MDLVQFVVLHLVRTATQAGKVSASIECELFRITTSALSLPSIRFQVAVARLVSAALLRLGRHGTLRMCETTGDAVDRSEIRTVVTSYALVVAVVGNPVYPYHWAGCYWVELDFQILGRTSQIQNRFRPERQQCVPLFEIINNDPRLLPCRQRRQRRSRHRHQPSHTGLFGSIQLNHHSDVVVRLRVIHRVGIVTGTSLAQVELELNWLIIVFNLRRSLRRKRNTLV